MPISLAKPVRTFTVVHQRGEVLHVVPARAEIQRDGSLGPYADVWRDAFARCLKITEVQAVDRWSAVQAAAEEIGPYMTERQWVIEQLDQIAARNRSANPLLTPAKREAIIDTLLESGTRPLGSPVGRFCGPLQTRRHWLTRQGDGALMGMYRIARGIPDPAEVGE
ncbi:hypothetical protein [Streptomyces sp. bgisy060]|uniref:hypothetical protein n=1 Tax=Streptomyces sp. bgisy060 TaxID=3413775 RepID=UPI003EC106B4